MRAGLRGTDAADLILDGRDDELEELLPTAGVCTSVVSRG
jgi:hypothetical protein